MSVISRSVEVDGNYAGFVIFHGFEEVDGFTSLQVNNIMAILHNMANSDAGRSLFTENNYGTGGFFNTGLLFYATTGP